MLLSAFASALLMLATACAAATPASSPMPAQATSTPASATSPTRLAPAPTTPAAATTDPAAVVTAYYLAVNAKDLDKAMTLVADDATFKVLGLAAGVKTGKSEIRAWLQSVVDHGNTFELSNLQVTGGSVTYSSKVFLGSRQVASGTSTAIVQEGRIKSLQEK